MGPSTFEESPNCAKLRDPSEFEGVLAATLRILNGLKGA